MHGVIDGRYQCNQKRTQDLSDRMFKRTMPSQHMQMYFSPRSVQTRYVHMPMLDCRKPNNTPCETLPTYDVNFMYSPSDSLPFNGFQNNVDTESKLKNIIFPLQKAAQAKYLPDEGSDLYVNYYLTANNNVENNPHKLLNKRDNLPSFNPNKHNIGKKLFNNNTRVQIRSLE
jgi:hypothetical protein